MRYAVSCASQLQTSCAVASTLLGPQDLFQLAVIEENAPAVLALFQPHPLLVDGSEGPMEFRTYHASSIRSGVLCQQSESARPNIGSLT